MKIIEKTYDTPEENLACEEAFLLDLEENGEDEVLRIWEPPIKSDGFSYFVVIGHANRVNDEVNLDVCRHYGVKIVRRCSGGGTVLNGPGCLNYSLYLRMDLHPELETIQSTNRFVLEKMKQLFDSYLDSEKGGTVVEMKGTSDLTVHNKKFSGNAQSRKRRFVLFHGTVLYNFEYPKIAQFLKLPPKQPDYRNNRLHIDFVMNMNLSPRTFSKLMKEKWVIHGKYENIPEELVKELVKTKYSQDSWNFKF